MITGKTILLISQQDWGKIHLSKHNYAIELAQNGNQVYFVCPPRNNLSQKVQIDPVAEYPGLFRLQYQRFFPLRLRDISYGLYRWLIGMQAQRIAKALPQPPDIVWSFEFAIFPDLGAFGAPLKVFHPVDPVHFPRQIAFGHSADIIFSISDKVLASFDGMQAPRYFINHGLSKGFAQPAQRRLDNEDYGRKPGPVRVGYVGNLIRAAMDREIFLRIIRQHPGVEFHIWGPTGLDGHNLSGLTTPETRAFIEELQALPQALLHGTVPSAELGEKIQDMDMFLLTYKFEKGASDRSNSHKLLEYISTGRTVVCSRIDTYVDKRHLLQMPVEDHDENLPELFAQTLAHLDRHNAADKQKARIEYALSQTYGQQLEKISQLLQAMMAEPSVMQL
jgi:hypothetical protein